MMLQHTIKKHALVVLALAVNILLLNASNVLAAIAPAGAMQALATSNTVDLIVEYDDTAIEKTVANMRSKTLKRIDDDTILRYKVGQYNNLKNKVDQSVGRSDIRHLRSYSHLPMSVKRFSSQAALQAFLAKPGIKAVYANEKMHRVLAESLPLIGQPAVASAGALNPAYFGLGSTVAVIDDGIDYSNAAFGTCNAPNSPASCRVVASVVFTSSTGTDNSHGTNVSAIVLGVAPSSKIAALNVFDATGSASVSDIIAAINWSIANQATYNIAAINMSLGGSTKFTSPCSTDWSATPITRAKNAGMSVAVASGNSQFTDGLSSPACAPNAISVGAVYDSNVGPTTWLTAPNCTDSTTAADTVTCFSNSANYLTLLAPGAFINAGGFNYGGTSQAAPHVAGALAVLRAAFPNETLAKTLSRMTSTGVLVTDTRNNITKPRLNLLAAARPTNDAFANRISLSGTSGSTSNVSLLASKETGEPNHANNSGGYSIWWKWTAPSAGQVSLNTAGSNVDTLLAVYTGSSVGALSSVAANDNDANLTTSSLVFQAIANKEYEWAVDGNTTSAAAGTVLLNWSLNTSAQANLSSNIAGPSNVILGSANNYTISVSNTGPQSASNVVASLSIPTGAILVSVPTGCTLSGNSLSCLLGTLASGGTQSVVIQLIWNNVGANTAITTAVSSDVPDSVATNNTASIPITQDMTANNNADIPILPEWGMLAMGFLLIFIMYTRKRA